MKLYYLAAELLEDLVCMLREYIVCNHEDNYLLEIHNNYMPFLVCPDCGMTYELPL